MAEVSVRHARRNIASSNFAVLHMIIGPAKFSVISDKRQPLPAVRDRCIKLFHA